MAWSFYYPITYDHTQCGTADSANFPALVYFSAAAMKDAAHGGDVQSSAGADILFFSDAGLTTQLASEIDYYDSVNGIGWFWVNVGTLSHSTNGTIYMAVGNASPPARTSGVWDSNFLGVYHLPNGTSLTALDSKGANNGTVNGATPVAGKIGGGAGFNGSYNPSATNIALASSIVLSYSASTFFCWFSTTDFAVERILIGRSNSNFVYVGILNATTIRIQTDQSGSLKDFTVPTMSTGVLYRLCITRASNIGHVYLNAIESTSGGLDLTVHNSTINLIGTYSNGNSNLNFKGQLDELTFSSSVRGWIVPDYNNQNSPGNIGAAGFWTWGSKTALSGGSPSLLSMGVGF